MTFSRLPATPEPTPEAIAAMRGPAVLEFGATWCGHCIAAQPLSNAVAMNTVNSKLSFGISEKLITSMESPEHRIIHNTGGVVAQR